MTDVVRSRLLAQFAATRPRVVVIAAPAGYGESTLARQIAAGFDVTAACDCASVSSERELWYAVLTTVRVAVLSATSESVSRRADVGADPSLENVLALIGEVRGSLALIFDNAEKALGGPRLASTVTAFDRGGSAHVHGDRLRAYERTHATQ